MNFPEFNKIFQDQPAYRLKQAYLAIFRDLISDWQQALNLPQDLRTRLNELCPLEYPAQMAKSNDQQTIKALISLPDEQKIETVLMQHKERNTVCLSSQVGCPLGCLFCATGQMGFQRNLTDWEICQQVLFFARQLKKNQQKINNLVFMGMGEPFLNYDNVIKAIKLINDKEGLNIGARHISISTIGIVEGINKLAQEKFQVNLALSLHATTDSLRSQIIPSASRYKIGQILNAVNNYIKKTNRKVMVEYLLIKNLNDSPQHARQLAKLLTNKLCFVNLISYNTTTNFQAPPANKIKIFKQILQQNQIAVTQRYKYGQDIAAACGQLASECK